MEINLTGGVKVPQSLPGVTSSPQVPAAKKSESVEIPQAAVDSVDIPKAEQRRFEQVKKASQSFFKDVYAVSDQTFTIFKDSTGQYITRFTSLRDGRVTYIPEPQLLQQMQSHRGVAESLIEIQA